MLVVDRAALRAALRHWAALTIPAIALCGCSALAPPQTESQIATFAARLSTEVDTVIEPPTGPLNADDAVARAVTLNLSVRAKVLEVELARAKALSAAGGMLPKVVAESNYYRRDLPQLSRSSQSYQYSTSSDLSSLSRDITLSWNILDFGLSFVRAKQGIEKINQQAEEVRRIRARIAEDTRLAFWRAVALDRLEPQLARLDRDVASAMRLAAVAAQDTLLDPTIAINLQRDILNLQRELNQLHGSIAGARHELRQLAGLQGLPRLRLDGRHQTLRTADSWPAVDADISDALRQRAEIRQSIYDLRITRDEIDATILQVLPSPTFSKTYSSDSNSYLLYQDWVSWGTRISGNLVNLARLDVDLAAVRQQGQVHRQVALATAATIVMQVHIARAKLAVARKAHKDAARFAVVQQQLTGQIRAAVHAGRAGQQALDRERLATLLADVRSVLAYAELDAAKAAYRSARGDEPPTHPAVAGWSVEVKSTTPRTSSLEVAQ